MQQLTFIQADSIKSQFYSKLKEQMSGFITEGDSTAIKLHMGEKGNPYFLKPELVKIVIDAVRYLGGKPFLFDSPVIYPGARDSVKKYRDHAARHGFTEPAVGCPIIISDDHIEEKTEHLTVHAIRKIKEADKIIILSHVKGHMCSGFGGALKNLGMGCVSITTKKDIHGLAVPKTQDNCIGCGICKATCPVSAITIDEDDKAKINEAGCWGCGQCVVVCPEHALKPKVAAFDTLIAEGAWAVIHDKKAFAINILKDISTLCDCCSDPGNLVVGDIGIIMGYDLVAVEKASLDKINDKAGKDIFKELHKKSPLQHIKEAEKLGLGSVEYSFS